MNRKLRIAVASAGACLLLLAVWFIVQREEHDYKAAIAAAEQALRATGGVPSGEAGEARGWSPDSSQPPASMTKEAETETLVLYMNRETTELAVKHKPSGKLWRSNPEHWEQDAIASGDNKAILSSAFTLTALTMKGQEQKLNSFADSVEHGQFQIEELEDGVKVIYTVGVIERGIESIPKVISEARFQEKLLDRLSDKHQQAELKKRFKHDPEAGVYIRRELTALAAENVLAILDEVGYTEEDLQEDQSAHGVESQESGDIARYLVPVDYRLREDRLAVSIDTGAVEQLGTLPLHAIALMEMFGAGSMQDEGYIFVPDGSGALITLNNGRTSEPAYIAPMYGDDVALPAEEKFGEPEPARLPVYGMKQGEHAWLAIVEEGDAIATIKADISGRLHSYNTASATFTVMSKGYVLIEGAEKASSNPVFQSKPYDGPITISYGFLHGEEADYSGMARMYREYLLERYDMKRLEKREHIPFMLELIGSVEVPKSLLGIPYEEVHALTTYVEAEEMIGELQERGVEGVQLRLGGWSDGGLHHSLPSRLRLEGALGSERELDAFMEEMQQRNVQVYPDTAFMRVYRKGKGFRPSRDSVKYISQLPAVVNKPDMPTFFYDDLYFDYYPLSPDLLPGIVDGFLRGVSAKGWSSLSLRDLGDELYANYDEERPINRQQSAALAEAATKELRAEVSDLMLSGGNGYAAPYAKAIVNAPIASNGYNITDESVPFYQLVFHGYMDMAAKPFNTALDQDGHINLLQAIESGSTVHYSWYHDADVNLMQSRSTNLYAHAYKDWIDEAARVYREADEALRNVRHQLMVKHEKLASGVYRTTYEDGTAICVNYNRFPVTVEGMTIEARSYWKGDR
ncbi:DUF5696 domain-containing protein [Paenibacillus sp. J5C_2022]|uniref:DUF5696 domain-containing protein n=1 Tax=Paenibacillus sp. J5C2022 TaxID=2977129 RepID=UPI0021D34CEA|nr:DUF5696 domain-containing protein [Paenibacillus sp. J5C2022]MCU6711142.1 DUF5696 domain-containing protein [Paenibacillus sp. J5C2022]